MNVGDLRCYEVSYLLRNSCNVQQLVWLSVGSQELAETILHPYKDVGNEPQIFQRDLRSKNAVKDAGGSCTAGGSSSFLTAPLDAPGSEAGGLMPLARISDCLVASARTTEGGGREKSWYGLNQSDRSVT
jgi:hypothetical protein